MAQPSNSDQTVEQSLALIDQIETLVVNSPHIPMTSRVVIDEEDLFEVLDHLREFLPAEIKQAQHILGQRTEILQEARDAAEKMLETAKEKTRHYLQEHELVKQAQKIASDTRQSVKTETKRQRYEADKYSEQVLADLEQKVNRALGMVKAGRQNLSQNMQETAQKLGI